jgi:hypothetical protein
MATEILRFSHARLAFHREAVVLFAWTPIGSVFNSDFDITVPCRHLDWQVLLHLLPYASLLMCIPSASKYGY